VEKSEFLELCEKVYAGMRMAEAELI